MEDSIFTKIIKGEIPCQKIYEDEKTLAFLDIMPVNEGHTLVIPKKQVEFVWDLDEDDYSALMETSKKVARHLREATKLPYVSEMVVGVDVPHAHIHLIPFEKSSDLNRAFDGTKLREDESVLDAIAEKLRF